MVILVGLAIDQIAQSGLSSLSVIYYSAQLFSQNYPKQSLCLSPYQKLYSEFIHPFHHLALHKKEQFHNILFTLWNCSITAIAIFVLLHRFINQCIYYRPYRLK
ncbi:hypothetical protein C2U43_06845 [Citrobacter freundii complex sp. CFNIH9]|nr:hypothetical protein C2U43_06845 [Citrobacter freundii complex sp. CFNIH9]